MLRPLKLVDLPNELLVEIFDYLGAVPWCSHAGPWCSHKFSNPFPMPKSDIDPIGKLRLTCRRFCNTSSHLLVRQVTVHLTRQSLAHLEEVARHPSISKGVRDIDIRLDFYSPCLAKDIYSFARSCMADLERETIRWNNRSNEYKKAGAKFFGICRSWHDVAANRTIEEDDREDTRILRGAHEHYRQRYEDQASLRRDNILGRVIASAMTRLPITTRINLDVNTEPLHTFQLPMTDMHSPGSLHDFLAGPLDKWSPDRHPKSVDQLAEIPSGLCIAFQQSSIRLTRLDVDIPMPDDMSHLLPANHEDCDRFRAAVSCLKAVSLGSTRYGSEREENDWSPLITFLSILLNVSSLEEIDLELPITPTLNSVVARNPTLLSHTWPMLKWLKYNGPFHLEDVKRIITQARNKPTLELDGCLRK